MYIYSAYIHVYIYIYIHKKNSLNVCELCEHQESYIFFTQIYVFLI